jgi:hypothetical protein
MAMVLLIVIVVHVLRAGLNTSSACILKARKAGGRMEYLDRSSAWHSALLLHQNLIFLSV